MDTFKKKEVNIKLSSITGLLSHGERELEFRFPELKSAMRFWWRALSYFEDAENMWKKESEYFGSQQKKSPVVFIPITCEKNYKRNDKKKKVKCFTVKIEFSMKCIDVNNSIENYLELLEFVSYVGGIGQKSSRGYGSFQIEEDSIPIIKDKVALIERIFTLVNAISNASSEENFSIKKEENKIIFERKAQEYAHVLEIVLGNELVSDKPMEKIKQINKDILEKDEKLKQLLKENRNPILYISCVKVDGKTDKVIPVISRLGYSEEYPEEIQKKYNNYCNDFIEELSKGGKPSE